MPEPLKLYLDQMFKVDVAEALCNQGYDVLRASETGQARADDKEIIKTTIAQGRILITLDEHFGDWVVLPLNQHPGVIRLKVHPTTSRNVLELLQPFLISHSSKEFSNHLVILSLNRVKWINTEVTEK